MERVIHGVKFVVEEGKSGPAFFALGVRKSGSSMFNRVCRILSRHNGLNFVDIAGSMFSNNVRPETWLNENALNDIILPRNVYGGFRNFPTSIAENGVFKNGKKALLVRDPRDALVSEYFSNAYSHSLPTGTDDSGARQMMLQLREDALAKGIQDYVQQRAEAMGRTMAAYAELLRDRNTIVFRYEDIVFQKAEMIEKLVKHFGWTCNARQMEAILGWVDVKPDVENPRQFIRKVTPGDHQEKLDTETIAAINGRLGGVLKLFGYA